MCGYSRLHFNGFFHLALLSRRFVSEEHIPHMNKSEESFAHRRAVAGLLAKPTMSAEDKAMLVAQVTMLSQGTNCSDPCDKVYAVYALLVNHLEGLPAVDYFRDKDGLYEDYTRATIIASGQFRPALLPPWIRESRSSLPSWVPKMSHSDVDRGFIRSILDIADLMVARATSVVLQVNLRLLLSSK